MKYIVLDEVFRYDFTEIHTTEPNIFKRLDGLRHDLLAGSVPKVNIAQVMRSPRRTTDGPRLNEITNEIKPFAEVEIAKHTHRT